MRGYPVKVKPSELSQDKDIAKKLWEVSEKLTKVKYTFQIKNLIFTEIMTPYIIHTALLLSY